MTSHRLWLAVAVLGCWVFGARVLAMPLPASASEAPHVADGPGLIQLAQAQAPQPSPSPASDSQAPAAPADQPSPAEEPIGNVASLTGVATVVRNKDSVALKLKDDIYLNDAVQTAASSSLGITFNDGTTFHLTANAKITIDNYVYEDGGSKNAGAFDIAKGTVAFVAAAVAKTGNMQITTPTSTLGIRGTTGLVEVPEGVTATSTTDNVNIKLYPDADGHVGRIEINDRQGARLGALTRGASGFAIRPGSGGARFAAVPITISPQQQQRDQGFVRQVHATQTVGRQIVTEQRAFRRANPPQPRQPGQPQQPGQNRPGQPARPQQPGQNRPAQPGTPQQPGQNRPGQPQQKGAPNNRQGERQPQPGAPSHAGQNSRPGTASPSGQKLPPGSPPRAGENARPANPAQSTTPSHAGENARPATPAAPAAPAQPNAQPRTTQPAPPPLPSGKPLLRQGGRPQPAPGVQKPRPPAKDKRKKP